MARPASFLAGKSLPDSELNRLWSLEQECQDALRDLFGATAFETRLGGRSVSESLDGAQLILDVAKSLELRGKKSPQAGTDAPKHTMSFRSNNFFQQIENVNYYTRVCKQQGVPDIHLFSPSDLSNPRELRRILASLIFATRWVDQPSGPRGEAVVPIASRRHTFHAAAAAAAPPKPAPAAAASTLSQSAAVQPVAKPAAVKTVPASSVEPTPVVQQPSAAPADIVRSLSGVHLNGGAPVLASAPPSELVTPTLTSAPPSELVTPTLTSAPPSELMTPTLTSAPPSELVTPTLSSAPPSELVTPTLTSPPPSELLTPAARPAAEISLEEAIANASRDAQHAAQGTIDDVDLVDTDELLIGAKATSSSSLSSSSSSRSKRRSSKHSSKSGKHKHKRERDTDAGALSSSKSSSSRRHRSSGKKKEGKKKEGKSKHSNAEAKIPPELPSRDLPASTTPRTDDSKAEATPPIRLAVVEPPPPPVVEPPVVSPPPVVEPAVVSPPPVVEPTAIDPPATVNEPVVVTSAATSSSWPPAVVLHEPNFDHPGPAKSILRQSGAAKSSHRTHWDPNVPEPSTRPVASKFEAAKNQFIEKWLSGLKTPEREQRRQETFRRATERAQRGRGLISGGPRGRAQQEREKVWDSDDDDQDGSKSSSSSDSDSSSSSASSSLSD